LPVGQGNQLGGGAQRGQVAGWDGVHRASPRSARRSWQ
jgi:hypothetical protein